MTQRLAAAFVALTVLAVGSGVYVQAHEGHDHKVMGTVTMAGTDHVMLKDKAGKDVTVYLKADTKIVRAKTAMKAADIRTNMRIVITAVTVKEKGKEMLVAKSIELGAESAAK